MEKTLSTALTIEFSPLLPQEWLIAVACITVLFVILSALFHRKSLLWRSFIAAFIFLCLSNPVAVEEERKAVKNIVTVIEDNSLSQRLSDRAEVTKRSAQSLKEELAALPDFDVQYLSAPYNAGQPHDSTKVFDVLDAALSDTPVERRAGTIIITDGQIHDIPEQIQDKQLYGPVHVILSGDKDEKDRRIEIIDAPAYGLVDEKITVTYKIIDTNNITEKTAYVSIKHNNKPPYNIAVPVNEEQTATFVIDRGGQNIIDFAVDAVKDELTEANNRAPIIVNGVRNRLKVLLVSGVPHTGGRTWRNLLTSDPGVDLVHFTILRDPTKLDSTPQHELSLIAFPFRELFEIKLYDFDLIIFDRYEINHILPSYYFHNIARYVKRGGAFLAANGPAYSSKKQSIYNTALKDILPARPMGPTMNKRFTPAITTSGERHPVTKQLRWNAIKDGDNKQSYNWGSWLRQTPVDALSGHTVMKGADGAPLLILDRVGEGRVAQLASDHIWLWSRGYEGGGPQADLLRRLAHWLMKEPELEETALTIYASRENISIERRTLDDKPLTVSVKKPDGTTEEILLEQSSPGLLTANFKPQSSGIYTIADNMQERFAVIGNLNAPEHKDILTTGKPIEGLVKNSGGKIWWAREGIPSLKTVSSGKRYAGRNWLGLKRTESFDVTGVKQKDLIPVWLFVLISLGGLVLMWWRESLGKKQVTNQ